MADESEAREAVERVFAEILRAREPGRRWRPGPRERATSPLRPAAVQIREQLREPARREREAD